MSDKDVLLSMGFDPARIEWALKATGNRGLQPAMDHIIENEGKSIPDPSSVTSSAPASSGAAPMDVDAVDSEELEALRAVYGKGAAGSSDTVSAPAQGAEAKSIKCSICEKTFKNVDLANYHAEKSGHDQFEESTEAIKPLTEEEKKQKVAEVRERMDAKRAVKAKEDAKEALANEAIRRKTGNDMGKIKKDMEDKQILKEVELKRKEKKADAEARAAIKAQIEADKKERALKAAREKALREGKPLPEVEQSSTSAPAAPSPSASTAPKTAGKDYPETRLQIRMAGGGAPHTTTLPSDSTLRDVADFLAKQTGVNVETVKFSLTFPRKTFGPGDFSRTLRELELTPSAVLIAEFTTV